MRVLPSFWHTMGRFQSATLIGMSLLALAGACGGESESSSSAAAGAAGTSSAGSASSAGSVSSGGSPVSVSDVCPTTPPTPGSSCPRVAFRCAYGDDSVDYLCTSTLTWRERTYAPAAASGGAAGSANEGGSANVAVQPAPVDCEASAECTGQCAFGCCNGGGDENAGCAGCCQMQPCGMISAEDCPSGVCQLLQGCDGKLACAPLFADEPPACGVVSYYGQEVACCDGLSLSCGRETVDGTCDPAAGGYSLGLASVPWCIDCGDGTCEEPYENRCNCAEDCG